MSKPAETLNNLLKKFLNFLIFSNVYVAFPVSFLIWQTYLITNTSVSWPLLLLVYFSTLFLYCFHRIYRLDKMDIHLFSKRHQWVIQHRTLFYFVMIVSFIGIIGFIALQQFNSILFLIPMSIIAFAYSIPLLPWKGQFIRLRDIFGLKVIIISAAVGCVTVILPLVALPGPLNIPFYEIIMLLTGRVFFIFAITIPFDIRDMKFDRELQTPTIPLQIGEKKALTISYAGLSLFSLITFTHYFAGTLMSLSAVFAFILSALITGWIISKASQKRSEYYFSLLVEGTMIIQTALVWIFYNEFTF